MQKKPCIHCKKYILEGIRFCPYCGTEQRPSHTSKNYDKNPFEILQVTSGAEDEVIKAAYKSLAKKYHPDVLKNGTSEERMKELNWAYSELSDPKKKKKWEKVDSQSAKPKQENKTEQEYKEASKPSSDPFGKWQESDTSERKTYKTSKAKTQKNKTETASSRKTTSVHKTEYRRNMIAIGIITSLLVLSIICVMSYSKNSVPNTTQNESSVTSQVENNENQTSSNISTITPTTKDDWELVLFERFSSNEDGWFIDEGYDKEYGTDQTTIKHGRLHWSGKAFNGFVSFRSPTSRNFTDFKLSFEVKKAQGENGTCSYGVFFRRSGNSEYSFVLSDRYYAFFVFHDNKSHKIIDWTYNPEIMEYGNNQVVITAIGPNFTFYINDTYITEVEDTTISSGSLGLEFGVYEEGKEAIIYFDDLKIEVPIGETQITNTSITNTPSPSIIGCVNVQSLNVREGPGLNYPILNSIKYGDCIEIFEITKDKQWAKSEKGWLFVKYLDIQNGSLDSLPFCTECGYSSTTSASTPLPTNTPKPTSKKQDTPTEAPNPSPTATSTPEPTEDPSQSPTPTWSSVGG